MRTTDYKRTVSRGTNVGVKRWEMKSSTINNKVKNLSERNIIHDDDDDYYYKNNNNNSTLSGNYSEAYKSKTRSERR
jgi:hypothetical protein